MEKQDLIVRGVLNELAHMGNATAYVAVWRSGGVFSLPPIVLFHLHRPEDEKHGLAHRLRLVSWRVLETRSSREVANWVASSVPWTYGEAEDMVLSFVANAQIHGAVDVISVTQGGLAHAEPDA